MAMRLQPGDPAPWFIAPTPSNRRYEFHMVAGRYVLLAFIPSPPAVRGAMLGRPSRLTACSMGRGQVVQIAGR